MPHRQQSAKHPPAIHREGRHQVEERDEEIDLRQTGKKPKVGFWISLMANSRPIEKDQAMTDFLLLSARRIASGTTGTLSPAALILGDGRDR